jgi:hypothetical protein
VRRVVEAAGAARGEHGPVQRQRGLVEPQALDGDEDAGRRRGRRGSWRAGARRRRRWRRCRARGGRGGGRGM